MAKINSYSMAVDAIAVCIALFLEKIATDAMFPEGASVEIFLVISVPLVILVVQVLRFLFAQAINRSRLLRRLILREDYIEGTWLGDSGTDRALVVIEIRGQDVKATGRVFDHDGEVILTWKTLSAHYDGDELRYLYISTLGSRDNPEEIYGYCTLLFVKSHPHSAPHAYSGYHVDVSSSFQKLKFESERITDTPTLKKLRTLEGTKQVIQQRATTGGEHSD